MKTELAKRHGVRGVAPLWFSTPRQIQSGGARRTPVAGGRDPPPGGDGNVISLEDHLKRD